MQVQLADLLLQGHPGHQVVDVLVHVGLGGAGCRKQRSGKGDGDVLQVHGTKIIYKNKVKKHSGHFEQIVGKIEPTVQRKGGNQKIFSLLKTAYA